MQTGSTERGMSAGRTSSVYGQVVQFVAAYLRQQGFSSIKANAEGFPLPGRVRWEEEDEGVVPHITGEHNGSVYVFEIETRDQIEPQQVEDRWRLLWIYARRHHGKFYLVVPETRAAYLRDVVKNLNVKPEFLKLSGIE